MNDNNHYDLLVIGGGINGASIANLAAYNGLTVSLLEKNTIGSGTSSKSSKLLHGGLRYLENFEFDLVKESLKERTIQLESAPSLTRPLGFIIPIYKDSPRPLWMMKLGVSLYDFLSGDYCIHPRRALSVEEVLYFSPELRCEGLMGGIMYYDAQMDDLALCKANSDSARIQGAKVFENSEVVSFIYDKEKTIGVETENSITKERNQIFAKHIIVAAGPWTNSVMENDKRTCQSKVRTTKGVHLMYKKRFCEHALLLQVKKDKRIFFVLPWNDETLIGTTDTDYTGNPDHVKVEQEDIDYLFTELKNFITGHKFSEDNIVSSFAGLRPLVYQKGSASKVSRKHVVEVSDSGVVYVMGGKYTTYRLVAEDALKRCLSKELKDTSQKYPIVVGK